MVRFLSTLSLTHLKCKTNMRARLLLADGTRVEGCGFGYPTVRVGEIVFSTSMTGYVEALTDPSYAGQILIWTHPMVGCYGVPSYQHSFCGVPLNYESDKIHVESFIVSELPPSNHYLSIYDLDEWLRRSGVPGMYRVDTRALVKKIREHGVMMSVIAVYRDDEEISWEDLEKVLKRSEKYDSIDFTRRVSPDRVIVHEPEHRPVASVALLDCGVKYGILRQLLRQGFRVIRFPCWSRADELIESGDGIVLSNGPGNPALMKTQIETIREIAYSEKPVLGVCLGMQLLSLSLGARTYKLRYGHRGPNKGVIDLLTKRSYVTTQNHGYAVDESSLEETELILWFKNIDDGSVEGVIHKNKPIIATQFHPEGSPGPHDTTWVFEYFKRLVNGFGKS
ncbi:MAG: glutamine-hydrolyzing carbamoyl-phosphate synthase small subunit [Sulfolobales archaeon]